MSFHRFGNAADHPTVMGATPDALSNIVCLPARPYLREVLLFNIAHAAFHYVAGPDFAIGIEKERFLSHRAGQQSWKSLDIIDKAEVEIGAEPIFGAWAAQ